MNTNSVIFWRGTSLIDNKTPIIMLLSGLHDSANIKTGNMLQTFIFVDGKKNPLSIIANKQDGPICGKCLHRKTNNKNGQGNRSCYVNLGLGGLGLWNSYKAGNIKSHNPIVHNSKIRNRFVRIGTYGDPMAVPLQIWQYLLSLTSGHTGYTHQWSYEIQRAKYYMKFCMASVENNTEASLAKRLGYRYYKVVDEAYKYTQQSERLCPATYTPIQCDKCRACGGCANGPWTSSGKDIVVPLHGPAYIRNNVRAKIGDQND